MKKTSLIALFVLKSFLITGIAHSGELCRAEPESMNMDPERLSLLDSLIHTSIQNGDTPGAVVVVVRDSFVVYRKAYGWMQKEPEMRKMEENTIFDLASLTKPLATATAAMTLVEEGRLRLTDPVSDHVPEYAWFGGHQLPRRDQPRVRNLLTHTSGLPAYASTTTLAERYGEQASDSLMTYLCALPDPSAPGEKLTYSCPGFITLQKVVESITGMSLAEYSRTRLYEPLGMSDTFYLPEKKVHDRIAPTIYDKETGVSRGIVHDPLARDVMKRVSGNAGLFSTADDLAVFAAMMLNNGKINGNRVLSPATVRTMTRAPEDLALHGRALGWDLSSSFASNQGDLFGENAYGHTGYTGTSLVIDPDTKTAVILLTNRVYPDDSGSVIDLRAKVANVVAASILDYQLPDN